MSGTDYRALLDHTRTSGISPTELAEVVSLLQSRPTDADEYTLLHIVGLARDTTLEPVVSEYLTRFDDPMLARLALQILSKYWHLDVKYRDTIVRFASGESWDYEDDARQMAISIAGEYYREHGDRQMLELLLRTAASENARGTIREDAVRALARALGEDPTAMPPASRRLPLNDPWSVDVLVRAEAELSTRGG